MGLYFVGFLVVCVLPSWAWISDASIEFHGRSLLQTPTSCPIDFEHQNYSIITSKCRGPNFPADVCCSAFKEFACPLVDEIEDTTTNCASTMFSYIDIIGNYRPGLFASECNEGNQGLDCRNVTSYKATNSPSKNSVDAPFSLPPLLLVSSCTVLALLMLLMV